MNGLTRATGITAVAVLCTSVNGAIAQTPTGRIVSAANAFLASLDETQRKSVSFAFDDEQQRAAGRTCRRGSSSVPGSRWAN